LGPAEIADHIVPYRGDVNPSPDIAAAQPRSGIAALIFDRERVSASWNGRAVRKSKEE
jgi:hypothetical protein